MAILRVERFPDDLFRRLKAAAAYNGMTLQTFVTQMVVRELATYKMGKAKS